MNGLWLDLRHAARALRNRPAFSALAILTLAIGIGVNAVAFSAINALFLKPLSLPGVDRLGWILIGAGGAADSQASLPEFEAFAQSSRTLARVAAEGRLALAMRGEAGTEQVWALAVSAGYFPMLGARPRLGRLFDAADLQATDLRVVVSERFWSDRLGGGSTPAQRSIVLNGQAASIIGVLPDRFQGPGGIYEPEVWLPIPSLRALQPRQDWAAPDNRWLTVIGELLAGSSAAAATADMDAIVRAVAAVHPEGRDAVRARFVPMTDGHPDLRGLEPVAWTGLAIVGIVLLIACSNVAGLLLARATERQRDLAIRAALGGSRARLIRQQVLETALLAATGGLAALVVASWSTDLLAAFSLPAPIPQRLHMAVDRRVVLFTAMLVSVAALLPGLVPAWRSTRAAQLDAIGPRATRDGRRRRAQNGFVVLQVAGSTLFLAATLLFARSFWASARFDPGFETAHLLTLEIDPAAHGYDAPRARALLDQLVPRIRGLAGVQSVALSDRAPFYVGFANVARVDADGSVCHEDACRRATVYALGESHFATLGVRLRAGREFTSADLGSSSVVVISEAMARRLWPGESAVGRWLRTSTGELPVQVVGVAADIAHRGWREPPASYLYRPLNPADYQRRLTFAVRTADDPRRLFPAIREQLRAIDDSLPIGALQTMAERMEVPLWPVRTGAGLSAVCGTLALVLAAVGLFGVTFYTVAQRTREFGIRLAIGATSTRLLGLVLRDGLGVTLPGIGLGLVAALGAGRWLGSMLYGVSPSDPASFVTAALLQGTVALAACLVPAYRATKADPVAVLRAE